MKVKVVLELDPYVFHGESDWPFCHHFVCLCVLASCGKGKENISSKPTKKYKNDISLTFSRFH